MSAALKQPTFPDLYRELRALPDTVRGEILYGSLVVFSRPVVAHSRGARGIGMDVGYRFDRKPGGDDHPGGWLILPEPELHLHTAGFTHVVSPDIAGWKRETLPLLPSAPYIDVTPDWVCEILSPSTARYDRREKARIYHQSGVTWRWLVDPAARTLEAYRREGEFWILLGTWGPGDEVRAEPFAAVAFDVETWWEGMAPAPEE